MSRQGDARTWVSTLVVDLWAHVPVRRRSLRRASRSVVPSTRRHRFLRSCRVVWRASRRLGWLGYLLLVALPFVPLVDLDWKLLGDPKSSEEYLETLWQVVGVVLGLSVAMVAIVFEGFVNAGTAISVAHFASSREQPVWSAPGLTDT